MGFIDDLGELIGLSNQFDTIRQILNYTLHDASSQALIAANLFVLVQLLRGLDIVGVLIIYWLETFIIGALVIPKLLIHTI